MARSGIPLCWMGDGGVNLRATWDKIYGQRPVLVITTLIVLALFLGFRVHRATCTVDVNQMIGLAVGDPDTNLGPGQTGQIIDWTKPILEQAPGCCRLVRRKEKNRYDDWYTNYMAYYKIEFLRSDEAFRYREKKSLEQLEKNSFEKGLLRSGKGHAIARRAIRQYLNRVHGVGVFDKCGSLLLTYYTED
ncbi:MAG: hypothetical protein ACRCY3_04830 [Sphingorhabdus sp.]